MNIRSSCRIIVASLPLFAAACVTKADSENTEAINAAKEGINFCLAEFESKSGHAASAAIDRVVAYVAPDKIDLAFAKGEVGLFGPRDPGYTPYFSCGILRQNPLSIYFLYEIDGPNIFLVETQERQIASTIYSKPFYQMLFLKRGENYDVSEIELITQVK